MSNETDLPTQQKKKTKELRIPQKNEDKRRKKNRQSPPSFRPQGSHDSVNTSMEQKRGRVSKKFPKSARLLTRPHYQSLYRHSSRLFGSNLSINVRQGHSPVPKLGITVSRKFGKAHDRNRFKRVVREAFRELYPSLPADMELNISPRHSNAPLSKEAVLVDLQRLLGEFLKS